MDIWLHGFPLAGVTAALAARTEEQGFGGLLLADSQLLVGDPYVELVLAGAATSRLPLGVAVTNPITRHPSVTASSILTVHAETAGRAVLGFGRGDSALRQLGAVPATTPVFERALRDIQRYLGAPATDGVSAGVAPIGWLPEGLAKVPVDVAATGPKTIAIGAVLGDRVTFNLGADADRLRWAVGVARDARRGAGLDPDAISLGAYVDVACADTDAAVEMVRGSASIFIDFLAEGIRAGVPVSPEDRRVADAVAGSYDEAAHGQTGSPQSAVGVLPAAFLERFALVGDPDALAARIARLEALGLDRLVMVPASRNVPAETAAASTARIAAEVLPRVTTP